jgi:hypothetical protein
MNRLIAALLCLSLPAFADAPKPAAIPPANADTAAGVSKASAEMAQAAKKFLDSLSPEQRATAGFEFADNERFNWHFIPKPRKGLTLKDMSEDQRKTAKALLSAGLSQQGSTRVLTIMSLEQILHEIEQGKGPKRDEVMYYWTVFGKPGDGKPWGWRVEGHHLSVNFTIAGDTAVAAGPAFLGTNPAEVRDGPRKGLRVLAEEEDMARALVKSLSDEQAKKAVIAQSAPKDILTEAKRQAVLAKFEGIPYGELTDPQKAALTDLLALYANRLRPELARHDLKRIAQAGLDKVYFAWAGGIEKGQGHYYRIHGPTFLVEYDNVQNNANHVHSVWRDLENDFGGDLLKKHYDEHHKDKK